VFELLSLLQPYISFLFLTHCELDVTDSSPDKSTAAPA
jgi:hypothetical protein